MSLNTPTSETRNRRRLLMAAAAAVVVIGIAGIALANNNRDDDQSPSATTVPTVAPTTTVAPPGETGFFEGAGQGSPSVTYTVPDGWEDTGFGVVKRNPMIGVYLVNAEDNFYTSYCRTTSTAFDHPVGPTVDDLVSAWANQPGVDATARDVTIDGFDGKQIKFTVPNYNFEDCAGLHYRCSGLPRPTRCIANLLPVTPTSNLYYQARPNQHQKVWVLDVDGTRLMIVAWSLPEYPAAGPSRPRRDRGLHPDRLNVTAHGRPVRQTAPTPQYDFGGGERRMPARRSRRNEDHSYITALAHHGRYGAALGLVCVVHMVERQRLR